MNTEKNHLLPCIEVNPTQAAKYSLIWLHGLGADGHDFVPIVKELTLPAKLALRFVFPHAPMQAVTINQGHVMRAWFDIKSFQIDRDIDEKGIQQSIDAVKKLIEQENILGIPAEKIVIGGFSQGALIALRVGLSHDQHLAGIVALSGFLPQCEAIIACANPINSRLPIFIGHGTDDAIVPYILGETTAEMLKQAAYRVSWHSYNGMPHSVCEAEIRDISQWLANTL